MISEKKYYDFLYENFLVKNKEQWEKANYGVRIILFVKWMKRQKSFLSY